jgi:hypothetical protein
MNMPGFNAESSLGTAKGVYRGNAVFGASGALEISLAQAFMISSTFSQNPAFRGNPFPPIRCCAYVPHYGLVCTTRQVRPLQQCECTTDFLGFPLILCHDLVLDPTL